MAHEKTMSIVNLHNLVFNWIEHFQYPWNSNLKVGLIFLVYPSDPNFNSIGDAKSSVWWSSYCIILVYTHDDHHG